MPVLPLSIVKSPLILLHTSLVPPCPIITLWTLSFLGALLYFSSYMFLLRPKKVSVHSTCLLIGFYVAQFSFHLTKLV